MKKTSRDIINYKVVPKIMIICYTVPEIHSSVTTIKENVLPGALSFDLPPAFKEDINKIVKSLNVNKATGPDGKPLKLIKISVNVVNKYLTNIINHDISRSYFSDCAKNALVRPIYKQKDRQNKEHYLPVSILNGFSKVYERFINDSMLPIIQTLLSNYFSLQKTLQYKPCTDKSIRELEKKPSTIITS